MKMESSKMAELRYEAPLATFDMDEWNEFIDETDLARDGEGLATSCKCEADDTRSRITERPAGEDFDDETFSGSLEDLVNTFDDKIIKCFRNYGEHAETIAPVQQRSEDEILADSQTWWTLTGHYGNILPIDWTKTYSSSLPASDPQETSNDLRENVGSDVDTDANVSETSGDLGHYYNIDSSDDLLTNHEEPVVTADEVISELEDMLEGNSPLHRCRRQFGIGLVPRISSELLQFTQNLVHPGSKMVDTSGIKNLPLSALYELRDELNHCIMEHSEVLIQELDKRDELEYEKELKNHFIWLLLTVQKRRKEVLIDVNGRRKIKTAANGYLTTVIPYQSLQGPPPVEKLQIYIRILTAINENSSTVPALLTDYILKGNDGVVWNMH